MTLHFLNLEFKFVVPNKNLNTNFPVISDEMVNPYFSVISFSYREILTNYYVVLHKWIEQCPYCLFTWVGCQTMISMSRSDATSGHGLRLGKTYKSTVSELGLPYS
jgi:hypothetical protein